MRRMARDRWEAKMKLHWSPCSTFAQIGLPTLVLDNGVTHA